MEAKDEGAESTTDVDKEVKPDVSGTSKEVDSSTNAVKTSEGEEDEKLTQEKGVDQSTQEKDVSPVQVLTDAEIETLSLEEPSHVDPAVIELLTSGFVDRFLQNLRRSQATIDQVRSSQEVLYETVQQEVAKFRDCQSVKDVEDTMVKARHYHNKLLRLRREMSGLHEKSKKLKKRALKLQQQKQTEELTRAHTREHELEKERMLTARLATSPPSPTQ